MKTSVKLAGLLFGLTLTGFIWAQEEEAQDQSGAAPEEAAETVSEAFAEDAQEQAPDEPEEQASEEQASEEQGSEEEGSEEQASDDAAVADPQSGDEDPEAVADTDEAATSQQPAAAAETAETAETFTFQGHPIFSPETAELVYRPLVNYLNDALPYRFNLELAPDYHRYWLSTRRGENPHLVLEEPHLTAYRMEQHDYTPLVRANQPITYSLLTSMNNAESSVQDFIGRRVSTMPAPSLGYLILTSWFDNPMQQPIIQSNAASWLDAVEIVFSQEADAAVVPHHLVSRYVNLANVLTSQEFPGVTIAASPDVPADIQEEIQAALLTLHEDQEHFVALNELDIDQFVEARTAEYEGLEEWLSLVYSIL